MQIARPLPRIVFFAACAAVLTLALMPAPPVPEVGVSDKVEHAGAFAVLAGLGLLAFPGRAARLAAGLLAFGVLIEVLQAVLPFGRDGEALDVAADAAGVFLVLAAARLPLSRRA